MHRSLARCHFQSILNIFTRVNGHLSLVVVALPPGWCGAHLVRSYHSLSMATFMMMVYPQRACFLSLEVFTRA